LCNGAIGKTSPPTPYIEYIWSIRDVKITITNNPSPIFTNMSGWESMWSNNGGLQKGAAFDAAQCEPALQDLIDQEVLPEGERPQLTPVTAVRRFQRAIIVVVLGETLVPGCGRGYAVAALAANGARRVLGVDIAPSAVKAANDYLKEGGHKGRVEEADFFGKMPAEEPGKYSLGYDCTFLCAISVDMRPAWAKAWHTLLEPGGELVTLLFPIRPGIDPAESGDNGSGPPYTLSLKLVTQLLEPLGFELVSATEVPPEKLARGSMAQETIARWLRR
jgi:methyl halide transferase